MLMACITLRNKTIQGVQKINLSHSILVLRLPTSIPRYTSMILANNDDGIYYITVIEVIPPRLEFAICKDCKTLGDSAFDSDENKITLN